MEPIISKALPEDALALQEIFHKTWLSTYPNSEYGITVDDVNDHYRTAYTSETLEKRKKQILEMGSSFMIFTAKIDGKLVGLCRVAKEVEGNKLRALYVLKEYQGKGIGTLLFKEAEKFFENKPIIVEVATYNTQAINFYTKLGFIDTGKRFSDERHKMKSGAIIPEMEMKKE